MELLITKEFSVNNGDIININSDLDTGENAQFEIMNDCLEMYYSVFINTLPFRDNGRGAYPFGRGDTLLDTKNNIPRIDVVYPDNSVAEESWVEPASLGTLGNHPLIHLKAKSDYDQDDRSDEENLEDFKDTIAHELAHALYFAEIPYTLRTTIEWDYLWYIVGRVAGGHNPGHREDVVTSKFIAWIECFGMLSAKLYKFRQKNQLLNWHDFQVEFIKQEKEKVGINDGSNLTGDDVEGALYGAIFIDFADRIGINGLQKAIGYYINSGQGNVLEFDDFRNWVIRGGNNNEIPRSYGREIIQVVNTWGL